MQNKSIAASYSVGLLKKYFEWTNFHQIRQYFYRQNFMLYDIYLYAIKNWGRVLNMAAL